MFVPFDNRGTVSVGAGTLAFGSSASSGGDTGHYVAASGAAVAFGGTRTIASSAVISGGGTIEVSGALSVLGNWTYNAPGQIVVANGSLTTPGAVTIGNLTLGFAGSLAGPGSVTVPAGGVLALQGSEAFGIPADNVVLSGGVRLVNKGSATMSDPTYSDSGLVFVDGAVFENAGSLALSDGTQVQSEDGTGSVINDAGATVSYTESSSGEVASVFVPFTDNGKIVVSQGTLELQGLSNLSSGVLSGGTYQVTGGTLDLSSAITTNSATIILEGTGAITSGGSNALSGLKTNTGSLVLGRSLTSTATLSNSGAVTLLAGTLQAAAYLQTAGTMTAAAGSTLKAGSAGTSAVVINGRVLTGNGTIAGKVSGTGTVSPGRAAGPLTITGTYTPASAGVLTIGVSGSTTVGTNFGRLAVSGIATLAGTLTIQTASGYLPPVGTTITILTAGQVVHTFSTVTGAQLSGEHWAVSYTATAVVLTATSG